MCVNTERSLTPAIPPAIPLVDFVRRHVILPSRSRKFRGRVGVARYLAPSAIFDASVCSSFGNHTGFGSTTTAVNNGASAAAISSSDS